MVKARSAGSFIGGIFNNPGIIILGGLAIALLFFQKDIRNAFGSLGQGLGNIEVNLPEIKLPEIKFPEFTFPEFKFPEIKLPTIFGNGLEQPQKMVEDTGLLTQEETLACECGSTITQDAFGNVNNVCKQCAVVDTALPSLDPALNVPDTSGLPFGGLFNFLGLTPAQAFAVEKEQPEIISNLPSGFDVFQTPGSSFVGAQINPTPIQNLSLSQIIDMFDVTASQAANIKAISQDDFGDFDFGTNTGGGIGSVIPSIQQFIGGSDVNVSSSQFEGLSAQEIANILTGGNIQNF